MDLDHSLNLTDCFLSQAVPVMKFHKNPFSGFLLILLANKEVKKLRQKHNLVGESNHVTNGFSSVNAFKRSISKTDFSEFLKYDV